MSVWFIQERQILKPFLLQVVDLYLNLHKETSMLHWFYGEERLLWGCYIGTDGAHSETTIL